MTDREYIKLNTSIQTGSHANQLREQPDGTIPATIELRLPDNLFSTQQGNKKIDTVSMLTTKFRVSLSETPIAQIPLDMELSAKMGTNVSTCKLDVFPFTVNDDGQLRPIPEPQNGNLAFPNFKKHTARYQFELVGFDSNQEQTTIELPDIISYNGNDVTTPFPTDERMSALIEKKRLRVDHCLNMCIANTHENIRVENGYALIKNINTLELMFREAIENAIKFAAQASDSTFTITLLDLSSVPEGMELTPAPDPSTIVHLDEYNMDACFWKFTESTTFTNQLKYACIPEISFSESSFTIAYDLVAFDKVLPFLANSSYVDTYDYPEQQAYDRLRSESWKIPPPKRICKGPVAITDETLKTYQDAVEAPLNFLAFNIIVNNDTKECFPFFPWNDMPYENAPQSPLYEYSVRTYNTQDTNTLTQSTGTTSVLFNINAEIPWESDPPVSSILVGQYLARDDHFSTGTYGVDWKYTGGVDINNQVIDAPPVILSYLERLMAQNVQFPIAIAFDFYEDDPGFLASGGDLFQVETKFNRMYYMATNADGIFRVGASTNQNLTVNTTDHTFTSNNLQGEQFISQTNATAEHDLTQTSIWSRETLEEGVTQVNNETNTSTTSTLEDRSLPLYEGQSFICSTLNSVSYVWRIMDNNINDQSFTNDRPGAVNQTILRSIPTFAPAHAFYLDEGENDPSHPSAKKRRAALIWVHESIPKRMFRVRTYYANSDSYYSDYTMTATYNVQNNTRETTRTYRETTLIAQTEAVPSIYYPNLISERGEKVYALNASSCDVNLSSSELFGSMTVFDITSTKTTTELERNQESTCVKNANASFGVGKVYQERHSIYPGTVINGQNVSPRVLQEVVEMENSTIVSRHLYTGTLVGTTITEKDYELLNPFDEDAQWTERSTATSVDNYTSSDISWSTNPTRTSNESRIDYTLISTGTAGAASSRVVRWRIRYNTTRLFRWVDGDTSIPQYGTTVPIPPAAEPCLQVSGTPDSQGRFVIYRYWELETTNETTDPNVFYNYISVAAGNVYPITKTTVKTEIQTVEEATPREDVYQWGRHASFTWNNLPTVVLSPIQSFVIILNGIQVSQEIQPINIALPGASSLTSTIPIVENYYSLASTLRDLHDELVVTRDDFADATVYKLNTTSGQERTITLSVNYITKDGRLHQLYIPKNGVYSLQLTFGISYYFRG